MISMHVSLVTITGISTIKSPHLASSLNEILWYIIFAGGEKDLHTPMWFVLAIRWRLRPSEAEPSFDLSLRWRHNGGDSVSNHQPRDCLLNC